MRHPKYQMIAVTRLNGKDTEEVVSKELMFKCDAERCVNWLNSQNSVFFDDGDGYWYYVAEYKKKSTVKE